MLNLLNNHINFCNFEQRPIVKMNHFISERKIVDYLFANQKLGMIELLPSKTKTYNSEYVVQFDLSTISYDNYEDMF